MTTKFPLFNTRSPLPWQPTRSTLTWWSCRYSLRSKQKATPHSKFGLEDSYHLGTGEWGSWSSHHVKMNITSLWLNPLGYAGFFRAFLFTAKYMQLIKLGSHDPTHMFCHCNSESWLWHPEFLGLCSCWKGSSLQWTELNLGEKFQPLACSISGSTAPMRISSSSFMKYIDDQ